MVLVIAELTLNMCVQQSKRATASLKFSIYRDQLRQLNAFKLNLCLVSFAAALFFSELEISWRRSHSSDSNIIKEDEGNPSPYYDLEIPLVMRIHQELNDIVSN